MAAVTILNDFRAQEEEICHYFNFFPLYLLWSNGARWHDLSFFLIFSFKVSLSFFSFNFIKKLFSSSSLFAIKVVSFACLRLLMFLPPVLIPACNLSSPEFLMMCSAHRLNKQGDCRQPCHTLFSILSQSVVTYSILTVASWPAYRFLRRQVRYSHLLKSCHCLLWSTQSKALV